MMGIVEGLACAIGRVCAMQGELPVERTVQRSVPLGVAVREL